MMDKAPALESETTPSDFEATAPPPYDAADEPPPPAVTVGPSPAAAPVENTPPPYGESDKPQPPAEPALPPLESVIMRSFVTGIVLIAVGFGYFVVGCASAGSALKAEGIIVGGLNMLAGAVCIYMKFKLPKITTLDSLVNHTWWYIVFGCISLGTGFGDFRFVVQRVVFASIYYDRFTRKFGAGVASAILAMSASAMTFVLLIIILSCVMLSCSGTIRRRVAEVLINHVNTVARTANAANTSV